METYQNKRKKKKESGFEKICGGCCQAWKEKNSWKRLAALYYFFLPPEGPGLDCPEQIFSFADFFLFYGWDLKAILKVEFQHPVTEQLKELHSRVYYYQIGWKVCLIGWMCRKVSD